MATVAAFDELSRLDPATFDPFPGTDRSIRPCVTRVVRRFGRLKSQLHGEDDAYRAMALVYACFADAWQYYHDALSEAHRRAYRAVLPRSGQPDDEGAFARYAASYALPEGFVPRAEWERKRARCHESVMADRQGGRSPAGSVDTSRNLWARQLRQGADDMTLLGTLDAYADAGVSRVRFVTQRDGRVCEHCRALDGSVYRIGEQPRLPIHWNCRCLYVPVIE